MSLISATTFTALDFESAGISRGSTDEPVQMAWGTMHGADIDPSSFFVSHLRCDKPITWAAQKVHGITCEDLAGAPSLTELWPRVRDAMQNRVLVAHGAGTEKRFLRAFPFHGFGPWADTLTIARAAYPDLADHSLGPLLEHLGLVPELDSLCPGRRWHDALYDAVACLVFLRHLISQVNLAGLPSDVLQHPDASVYYKNRSS